MKVRPTRVNTVCHRAPAYTIKTRPAKLGQFRLARPDRQDQVVKRTIDTSLLSPLDLHTIQVLAMMHAARNIVPEDNRIPAVVFVEGANLSEELKPTDDMGETVVAFSAELFDRLGWPIAGLALSEVVPRKDTWVFLTGVRTPSFGLPTIEQTLLVSLTENSQIKTAPQVKSELQRLL